MILKVLLLFLKYFIQFGLVHSLNNIKQSNGSDVNNPFCDSPNGQMYWPHPTNCHTYIQCTSLGPLQMHCAPGTAWSQSMLICNQEAYAECEITPSPNPSWDDTDGGKPTLPTDSFNRIRVNPSIMMAAIRIKNTEKSDEEGLYYDTVPLHTISKPPVYVTPLPGANLYNKMPEILFENDNTIKNSAEKFPLPEFPYEMPDIQHGTTIHDNAEKIPLTDFANKIAEILIDNTEKNPAGKFLLQNTPIHNNLKVFTDNIHDILIDSSEKISSDMVPVKEKSESPDSLAALPDLTNKISKIEIARPTKYPILKVISSSHMVPAHVKLCDEITKYINDMFITRKDSTHRRSEILLDQNKIRKTCAIIAKYLTDAFQEKASIWMSPNSFARLGIYSAELNSDHNVSEPFTSNKPGSTSKSNDKSPLDQLADMHTNMSTANPSTIRIINKEIVQLPNLQKDPAASPLNNVIQEETFALTSSYPAYEKEMMTPYSIYSKKDTQLQNLNDGDKDHPFFYIMNDDFDEMNSDSLEKDLQIVKEIVATELIHNLEKENNPNSVNSEENHPLSKMAGRKIDGDDILYEMFGRGQSSNDVNNKILDEEIITENLIFSSEGQPFNRVREEILKIQTRSAKNNDTYADLMKKTALFSNMIADTIAGAVYGDQQNEYNLTEVNPSEGQLDNELLNDIIGDKIRISNAKFSGNFYMGLIKAAEKVVDTLDGQDFIESFFEGRPNDGERSEKNLMKNP